MIKMNSTGIIVILLYLILERVKSDNKLANLSETKLMMDV